MHDAKERELKPGDIVMIPCKVTRLSETPDFCNIDVTTLGGRNPDGVIQSIGYINARQVYRANENDSTEIKLINDNGKVFLK